MKDILTPLIAALGGQPDFSALTFTINHSKFLYGDFINAIIAFLNKALNDVVQSAEFKQRMAALGMSVPPAAQNSPQYLADYMRRETARQAPLAALTGIKLVKPQP